LTEVPSPDLPQFRPLWNEIRVPFWMFRAAVDETGVSATAALASTNRSRDGEPPADQVGAS
jgi:hypothetical protein